jgi:hypothetical protein
MIILFILGLMSTHEALNGQSVIHKIEDHWDGLLEGHLSEGRLNYSTLSQSDTVQILKDLIRKVEIERLTIEEAEAFYLNAYNIFVISSVLDVYPINSVKEIPQFFEKRVHTIGNRSMSLNEIEEAVLGVGGDDARIHFALVCGSMGCPREMNMAFKASTLSDQLQYLTEKALSNKQFVKINALKRSIEVSQIFQWYRDDFVSETSSVLDFIKKFSSLTFPEGYELDYYQYDWTLNDLNPGISDHIDSNLNLPSRYIVSAVIPRNGIEVKLFNNLYTEVDGRDKTLSKRSTYFTTFLSALYGIKSNVNVGLDLRYRRVFNNSASDSPIEVFRSHPQNFRSRITSIGPKVRWAPNDEWPNFSIQSALWFPLGEKLEGGSGSPFLDWEGMTWWTQIFNDKNLSNNWSLFSELGMIIEDMGFESNEYSNRFSTPATLILSYFAPSGWTFYAIGSFSPYWQKAFDYYTQFGSGIKYQFSRNVELELLYTYFTNKHLLDADGQASTFNIGLRYSR